MGIHVAKKDGSSKRFNHEGLHQLQNFTVTKFSFVTDEDPRGRNVLLEPSFLAT